MKTFNLTPSDFTPFFTRLLLLFTVISLYPHESRGQTVNSSCTAPDSIMALYQDDADRMAVRHVFDHDLDWKDSTAINRGLSDYLLDALLAVYNADSLPARDTVVRMADIHTFPLFSLNEMVVYADSGVGWVKEVREGNIPTGVQEVDSLFVRYGMSLERTSHFTLWQATCMQFVTERNYNIKAIAPKFDSITGVLYSGVMDHGGGGHDIQHNIQPQFVQLTYSYGWTDCPMGCFDRRYWTFRVYDDCSVEYMGSYGDIVPGDIGIAEKKTRDLDLWPNPFAEHVNLSGIPQNATYELYNSLGQQVQGGPLQEDRIKIDAKLPAGAYFLVIRSEEGKTGTYQLVKE